ncbi:Protein transport protein sec73 [Golovinomyces cichoracearum]|uniref:Protein transport protein sec73 n=1 Tax=Golovinomyces cichoracearum TaxID=62708 RepID=A0A420HQJ7_9PEZI|nr:Protein transport protein sec73 [Golovinomyces cichoracearum]
MPPVPGFYRKGALSDLEPRRRSLDSTGLSLNHLKFSEQISQIPSTDETISLTPSRNSGTRSRASLLDRSQFGSSVPSGRPESSRPKRLFKKLRYASESQLSTKARLHAQFRGALPPLPPTPNLGSTASKVEPSMKSCSRKKPRETELPHRSQTSLSKRHERETLHDKVDMLATSVRQELPYSNVFQDSRDCTSFDANRSSAQAIPPPYGDDGTSTIALPVNRLSDSSRSDLSSGEHGVYASTTTTHTVHTTTTFFRLPRRRKQTTLFDLSHLPRKSTTADAMQSTRVSRKSGKESRESLSAENIPQFSTSIESLDQVRITSPPSSTFKPSISKKLVRKESRKSNKSSPTRSRHDLRRRSSTLNSLQLIPNDDSTSVPMIQSTRTSTSAGRKSFGDFFGLSYKFNQNSESAFQRHSGLLTSGTNTPKSSSIQISREIPNILPERHENDTPAKYLIRLEEAVSRGVIASVLSKGVDSFSQAVLRSYMRGFGFFGDPMDMAIRKLLMEVELPKETQQIDRCLQGFANRYHECNPGIYASPDQAYFVAFSLLILHTDVFNKNNKHKMQKSEYLKNTRGEGIFDEILECFYDNISYTPFIHVEDDLDINGERTVQLKTKKRSLFSTNSDSSKQPSKEPVDPYTLIIYKNLDSLRPNLKDILYLEEHYSYLGTAPSLNLSDLQKTFFRTGILQIVSARSRPDAFMSDRTVNNPEEAQAGIVDIKITKVGLLWRKDPQKKKTRSPWQEWGAILTGAQLYFFKNTTWIKSLMNQLDTHIKQGHDGTPVIFKPPLDQFKPDALMSTDDSVALQDSLYKKHKNAFIFVRHAGFEETFIAGNEEEMNDWLAKLNYAAAFRTSRVRMRGLVGGNYDGQRFRSIRSLDHLDNSVHSAQTLNGDLTVTNSKIDSQMAQDIFSARREIMVQKIAEEEEKLAVAQKNLESQLRNARHLQMLTPIQQRTRDNILMAAGKMAAQLKWGRIRIWRLKCHRDILSMDLEEEKTSSSSNIKNTATSSDPGLTSPSRIPSNKRNSASHQISKPSSPVEDQISTSSIVSFDGDKYEAYELSQKFSMLLSSPEDDQSQNFREATKI